MFGQTQVAQQPGMSGSVFGANMQSQDKFADFVKQVAGEMVTWEKSGLWLLSALSPMKDYPLFPGFEDTSPEELRVAAYKGKTDTSAQTEYQTMLNERLTRHKQLRDALRTSTPETLQVLKDVFYNTKSGGAVSPTTNAANPFNKSTSLFGNTASASNNSSLFGKPAQQNSLFGSSTSAPSTGSVFGNTQTNQSVFGAPSTFGASSSSSLGASSGVGIFGNNSGSTGQTSLFGGANSVGSSSSVFGGGIPASSGTSVFGATGAVSTTATTSAGMFGSSNRSLFGGSTSGSVFGAATSQPSTGSMFGQSTSASAFGGSAPSSSFSSSNSGLFGGGQQSQPSSLFGNSGTTVVSQGASSIFGSATSTQQQPSVFGGSQTALSGQQSGSIFGGGTQQTSSVFGGSSSSSGTSAFGVSNPQQGTTSSLFGGVPQQSGSVFDSNSSTTQLQSGSLFGNSQSVFGGGSVQQGTSQSFGGGSIMSGSTPQQGTSIFGNNQQQSQEQPQPLAQENRGIFGQQTSAAAFSQGSSTGGGTPASVDDQRYTPLDKLSEQDRLQFESTIFTYIPLMPPPKELCF